MDERQQSIIKILEKHVSDMDNEFDTLDKKAQQNIAVSSIIAAIVGLLKLNETLPFKANDPALYVIFVLYGAVFLISFIVLYPRSWKRTPLAPTKENITNVEGKKEDEYYDWLKKSYLSILTDNEKVLRLKSRLVSAGIICIGLDVGVIIYAALSH